MAFAPEAVPALVSMDIETSNNRGGKRALSARVRRRVGAEADWAISYLLGRIRRFPNEQSLRIFAMRRSGHHAIVNWIRYHIDGRHYFLNDCTLGKNPFESAVQQSCLVNGYFGEHRLLRLGSERRGTFTYKGALLYNYEEADIRHVPGLMSAAQEEAWVGRSRQRHDVLILRDPFNLVASKLKWAYGVVDRPSKPTLDDVRGARDLWKIYAREFIGETSYLPDRVNISYNDWFVDRAHRDELAARLGFENRDLGIAEVAKWGPTLSRDSFDGLKYEGRAQDMKVLERWKAFADDPLYRELLADEEIHRLSAEIFGELEGTRALLGGAAP